MNSKNRNFLLLILITVSPCSLNAANNGFSDCCTFTLSKSVNQISSIIYNENCIAQYFIAPNIMYYRDFYDNNGQLITIRNDSIIFNQSQIVFKICSENYLLISFYNLYNIYGYSRSLGTYGITISKAYKIITGTRPRDYYVYHIVQKKNMGVNSVFYSSCFYGMSHVPNTENEFWLDHYWINAPSTYIFSYYLRTYFLCQLQMELEKCTVERMDVSKIESTLKYLPKESRTAPSKTNL